MGVRELFLTVVGVATSACLGAPSDPADVPPIDVDASEAGSDGAVDTSIDAGVVAACADAFAIAYTSRVSVRPAGGTMAGMLVIEARGDKVDLVSMVDGADDSLQLELQLTQPNYDLVPQGLVFGELDPESQALIIGPLVAPDVWAESATPTFQLTFSSTEVGAPLHRARAVLGIGTSTVALDFEVVYDQHQAEVAIPLKAARVASVCGE